MLTYCKNLDFLCLFPWFTSCSPLVTSGQLWWGTVRGRQCLGADPSSPSPLRDISRVRLMVVHECAAGAQTALCDIIAGICRVMCGCVLSVL